MKTLTTKSKRIITTLSITVIIFLTYFSDNIRGYYKFREICKKESGLRVFEKLDRNVGWVTNKYTSAQSAAAGEGVSFVRYKDEDGLFYDVKYIGGDRYSEKSFNKSPADPSKSPVYEWRFIKEKVTDQTRLGKSGYEITSINDKRLLVSFYRFGYSVFDRNSTILGAPSGESCGELRFWTPDTVNNIYN